MKITYEHQRYLGYYCLRVRMSLSNNHVERWFSIYEVAQMRPGVYIKVLRGMRAYLIRSVQQGGVCGALEKKPEGKA